MHVSRTKAACWTLWAGLAVAAVLVVEAEAQSGSLFGDPGQRPPLTLAKTSPIYMPQQEAPTIELNDLVTVIVDEKSQVISEGEVDRRKKADGTMRLKDWIGFDGWAIRPDPQSMGDPTVSGEVNSKYRAEAGLETRETMKFHITCRVVDIRPNGNVVLEGRRVIINNEESWELSLSGVIRPEDVLPNNTVLSETIAEMRIYKREAGHVRDAYRQGWLQKWMDRYNPF